MNIPKRLKCKMCGESFINPLTQDSKIAGVCCRPCMLSFFSKKGLRNLEKKEGKTMQKVIPRKKKRKKQPKPRRYQDAKTFIALEHYRS